MNNNDAKQYLINEKKVANEALVRIQQLIKDADSFGLDFRKNSEQMIDYYTSVIAMCDKNLALLN